MMCRSSTCDVVYAIGVHKRYTESAAHIISPPKQRRISLYLECSRLVANSRGNVKSTTSDKTGVTSSFAQILQLPSGSVDSTAFKSSECASHVASCYDCSRAVLCYIVRKVFHDVRRRILVVVHDQAEWKRHNDRSAKERGKSNRPVCFRLIVLVRTRVLTYDVPLQKPLLVRCWIGTELHSFTVGVQTDLTQDLFGLLVSARYNIAV